MNTATIFITIGFAALIHASFQLSTSMLTLLSSHTIGRKHSQNRLLLLTNSFVLGVGTITILLLSFSAMLLAPFASSLSSSSVLWVMGCGLLLALGIAVWLFYYRREAGTTLWIPRSFALYLSERTKKAKHSAEAFGLGMSSVVAEILFLFVPILISALLLIQLSPILQIVGVVVYGFVSSLSLIIVNVLIGSGHSISRIQRWRETNKKFLQFAGGSGLIVLGFYLYVNQVVPTSAAMIGGF